ncbi:MAG: hypothetical protein KF902_13425 [Phycisphaeraceae bacterium]|nr:hypothetical protein [Phycisphaeraceae bacterium]
MSFHLQKALRSTLAWAALTAALGVLLACVACVIAIQDEGHPNEPWMYFYDPAISTGPGPLASRIGLVVRHEAPSRQSLICGFPFLWLEIRDTHRFDHLVRYAPSWHTLGTADAGTRVRARAGALCVNAMLLGAPAAAILAALRRRRKPCLCLLVLGVSGWMTCSIALAAWVTTAPWIRARTQVHASAASLHRATGVPLHPQPPGTAFNGYHQSSFWLNEAWYSYIPYEEVGLTYSPNGRSYSWSRTGFPFRCLANGDNPDIWWPLSPSMASMYGWHNLLTCRVLPIPFFANTLLIALVLGGPIPVSRELRRRRRKHRGLCTQCAYPIALLPDHLCPECGTPIPDTVRKPS